MIIYRVQTYYYSTYSYSGIEPYQDFFFTTEEKALKFISDNNYKLVNNPEEDNEVTLEPVTVN